MLKDLERIAELAINIFGCAATTVDEDINLYSASELAQLFTQIASEAKEIVEIIDKEDIC